MKKVIAFILCVLLTVGIAAPCSATILEKYNGSSYDLNGNGEVNNAEDHLFYELSNVIDYVKDIKRQIESIEKDIEHSRNDVDYNEKLLYEIQDMLIIGGIVIAILIMGLIILNIVMLIKYKKLKSSLQMQTHQLSFDDIATTENDNYEVAEYNQLT